MRKKNGMWIFSALFCLCMAVLLCGPVFAEGNGEEFLVELPVNEDGTLGTATESDGQLRITKSPTGETVAVGESAVFVARAENATGIVWRIVSADTTVTYEAASASAYFTGLQVSGLGTERLVLSNIPASMDGWAVEAKFLGPGGPKYSAGARIHVTGAAAATPTPRPTQTPAPTPVPTAIPAPSAAPAESGSASGAANGSSPAPTESSVSPASAVTPTPKITVERAEESSTTAAQAPEKAGSGLLILEILGAVLLVALVLVVILYFRMEREPEDEEEF